MKKAFSRLRGLFTRSSGSVPVVAGRGVPILSRNLDSAAPQILMMSVTQPSPVMYTIRSGDTFASIAAEIGTTVAILEQANPNVDPSSLKVGEIIQLQPTGSQYTIQAGDTFNSIAAKFGLPEPVLEAANPGVKPTNLVVGSQLLVPTITSIPVAPPQSANPAPTIYTIQAGDTFNSIAKSLGVIETALEAANPSVNVNGLQVGSQIIIPDTSPPTTTAAPASTPTMPAPISNGTYNVQAGDTFNLIAGKLGTTAVILEGLNPSDNANALQIGAQIFVPSTTQATPISTPAPLPTPAPTPTLSGTYIIQAGDTFSVIAVKEGTTVALLEAANPSLDPTKLQIGASIALPAVQSAPAIVQPTPQQQPAPAPASTSTYTVLAGDTLSSIALAYSISLSDLEATNPAVTPNLIQIGQVINLPSNAASSIPPAAPTALPNISSPGTSAGSSAGGAYQDYSGGAASFPNTSQWASYTYLWTQNSQLMSYSNSSSEISFIKSAIDIVSSESGVDPRVILCIMMQESGGNIRVGNTFNGVVNTGIMQAFNGASFDANDPQGSVLQMVRDGTEGTYYKQGGGPGLKQDYAQTGNWYAAARVYNSGSVNLYQLNDALGATANYVRDFANRLMGHVWSGM
ncbi:uncharacterized protein PAC_13068 [Phialocephala subalpina]|uniref:LysM domain-containing protein n=1 Tax=Phialocephala subalpina TaxID=576137 RepID=A0A1L7XDS0_9HELO|nr:uncharacterized protein PAC_13068 [Phialocephala subalpina]